MEATKTLLALSFAILATLAGAGGGCFGRGKSSPPVQNAVYYKSAEAPVSQHTPPRKVVF